MEGNNYIYAPASALAENFRCKVPMKGTRQLFVIDGGVQGTEKPISVTYAPGESPEEILQVISVRTANHPDLLNTSGSYTFGRGAVGKLILCSHTFADIPFVTNERVAIDAGEGAVVEVVVMQNEHNGAEHNTSYHVTLAAGATVKMTFLTLHGGRICNNINVSLEGSGAECDLNGLYLVDRTQVVDNTVLMQHKVPGCRSFQLFKGVLDDSAVAKFSGLIHVFKDAQKTESYQENHNLLLSRNAKIYSEPQLEIYADDVKCSHGATNGRLDEEELFYLRSRGIPLKEAELLQQLAFAHAVIEKIGSDELKHRMSSLVEQRLRGEFSECRNCCKNCC